MNHPAPVPPRTKSLGAARWPGLIFGGIGLIAFAAGLGLCVDRLVIFVSWPEAEARVIESRIEPIGSQHRAIIRVEFELRGARIEAEPASDYRSSRHGWIAEAVERHPVGGPAQVRHHWDDPRRTRLDVGLNFTTFGLPLLLVGLGLVFSGVGALASHSARIEAAGRSAHSRADAVQLARGQYLGVGIFVGVIGLAMTVAGAVLAGPAWAARQWPVVTARVERTEILTRSTSGGKHSPSTFYVGRLFVSYEAAGKTRPGVLTLRNSSTDRVKVERLLAGIPAGSPRDIRVDPADPHRIESVDSWPLLLPGVFLFAGVAVTGVAALVLRSRPPLPPGGSVGLVADRAQGRPGDP
ncbi:MAG: DUF3592 domain-containing protein [Opitutaceae bacterium]|nr:DUF3592 domain-containing protein [Opitutaceae bacterium]